MRTRLFLETIEGRIVPDTTLSGGSGTPVAMSPPPETPWATQEISLLRNAAHQLNPWAASDTSVHAQQTTALLQLDAIGQQVAGSFSSIGYAISSQLALPQLQTPPMPTGPGQLQRIIQVAQGLRDLPGSPM
jgi:uncharacterized iron-regulated membrane protein